MAATQIKITVVSVNVLCDSRFAEWSFKAKVKRIPSNSETAFGSSGDRWETEQGDALGISWSTTLDIAPEDNRLEITLAGTDQSVGIDAGSAFTKVFTLGMMKTKYDSARDLGSVKVVLNTPVYHGHDLTLVSNLGKYSARITVEITAEDSGVEPGLVATVVTPAGGSSYSTIHEEMLESKMVHICPVIPVPWASGIPPIAKGVENLPASDQEDLSIAAGESILNKLCNPALIPVLDPLLPDFATKCARIRITQFRPKTLDLSKLIWKVKTDNIRFFDGGGNKKTVSGGREVKAYGVLAGDADQECEIEVRWDGPGKPLLATYRAWVGKPKYVWTRANIIKCSKATIGGVPIQNPTTTAAQIKAQIAYNNVLFWQSGVLMVPDTDQTAYNGAVRLDDGIFEVTSDINYTFNTPDSPDVVAPLLNQRAGVFNAAYLHTVAGAPTLNGMATDRRLSDAADGTTTLGGSPSTSWVQPTGVYPDAAATTITMKTMGRSDQRDNAQKPLAGDGSLDKICACIMTQQGATLPGSVTLVHELGHVLGLHHRGCGGGEVTHSTDGVDHLSGPFANTGHPWVENVMTYGPNTSRQDFDLIQTKILRSHPLVKDTPTAPPPKVKKPVPPADHPRMADRIMLQEYLTGVRPGLKKAPYDIGTSGPGMNGVDGVVGPKTQAAISSFQTDHGEGLAVDGIYGPLTMVAFDKEING
jgi:peptidoglycan hydrolase-like protein with peptidoglycan-binding domain